jgi:predicted HicB family RNase H-like nuclease
MRAPRRRTAKKIEMTNRGIYLTRELDNELVASAEREECSISSFVARAIKAAVDAQKRKRFPEDEAA